MSVLDQLIGACVVAGVAFVGGWGVHSVWAERAQLKAELAQVSGARVLEARDRRSTTEALADYRQVLEQVRAAVQAAPSKEEKDALQSPVRCAPGASAVAFEDVPVPRAVVDGLRRAGADSAVDQSPTR